MPVGAGLSSSAALECSVAEAAADLSCLALDAPALAEVAQRAENGFLGVPCGLMDQMASMACTQGHALLYDVRNGRADQVPFAPQDAGLALLVIDTLVKHSVGDGAYSDRRRVCEEAAEALGVAALRDIAPADLHEALTGSPRRRRPGWRHVVTEIARVDAAADALQAGKWDALGEVMTASHVSLRDDYEVSAAELDVAVDAALSAGALGARMTGAGFGGSAIAMVPAEAAEGVTEAVRRAFASAGYRAPEFFVPEPGPGASQVL